MSFADRDGLSHKSTFLLGCIENAHLCAVSKGICDAKGIATFGGYRVPKVFYPSDENFLLFSQDLRSSSLNFPPVLVTGIFSPWVTSLNNAVHGEWFGQTNVALPGEFVFSKVCRCADLSKRSLRYDKAFTRDQESLISIKPFTFVCVIKRSYFFYTFFQTGKPIS